MVQERLRSHERQLEVLQSELDGFSHEQNKQGREVAVIKNTVGTISNDITAIKADFESQMSWIRRGLWAAAGTFLVFTLALAQVAGG